MARIALDKPDAHSEVVDVLQLVGPGSSEKRPLLPSFVYFPTEAEGAQPLPWDSERPHAVGELARATWSPSRRWRRRFAFWST
jgi:hypothetical protein